MLRYAMTLLVALATAVGTAKGAPVIDLSGLEATPCEGLDTYEWTLRAKLSLRCATLVMSEGPSGSTKIRLAVAVLEPIDPANARRPPTVMIHGGPGIGIVDSWWFVAGMGFVQDGPVILFDQRGVGLSTPKLCPELDIDDPRLDKALPKEIARAGLANVKKCLAVLEEKGTDLTAYGTDTTVRDMEALRTTLKIEQWNIFGISYGTTVGLAYLAQHPTHLRAAILDSVYPPEMQGFSTIVPDFVASFDALNNLCAARPRCAARFGDLAESLRGAVATLDRNPLPLELTTAEADKPRFLSGSALIAIIQANLLFSTQWSQIPLLISDAEQRRPSVRLGRAFTSLIADLPRMNMVAYLSTECRERAPFENRTALTQQDARWPTIARATGVEGLLALCDVWPAKGEKRQTPRDTPVPTLVVAGEWDPATPATYAQRTATILGARANYILLRQQAHSSTLEEPCASSIARSFLRNPSDRPNAACAETLQPPMLATRLIELNEQAAYNVDLLPASAPVFIVGLLSALAWPIAWLARQALGPTPESGDFVVRSPFWLALAAFASIACAYPFIKVAYIDEYPTIWLSNGIPAEAWPTFLLLVLVVAATVGGGRTFISEASAGKVHVAQLLHRGLVLASLIAVLASFWRLGAIAQLPSHLLDEVGQSVSLLVGTRPPNPP